MIPRFVDAFSAATNCPWLRKPAVADSSDMPTGSMAVTFESWPGLLEIFTEMAFGGAGGAIVVGVVVPLAVVVLDVPVDVDVFPLPLVVLPPLVVLLAVDVVVVVVDPAPADVFGLPPAPLALAPEFEPFPCVVVEPPPPALVDPPPRVELPPEPTCVWPPPRAPFGPCAAPGAARPMTVTATTHPSRFMVGTSRNALVPRTLPRGVNCAKRVRSDA